jgi:hypothetical protein
LPPLPWLPFEVVGPSVATYAGAPVKASAEAGGGGGGGGVPASANDPLLDPPLLEELVLDPPLLDPPELDPLGAPLLVVSVGAAALVGVVSETPVVVSVGAPMPSCRPPGISEPGSLASPQAKDPNARTKHVVTRQRVGRMRTTNPRRVPARTAVFLGRFAIAPD